MGVNRNVLRNSERSVSVWRTTNMEEWKGNGLGEPEEGFPHSDAPDFLTARRGAREE